MAADTHDTSVEYLAVTRIGEKGQITVPKSFRQAFQLETGAPFAVLRLGAGLILLPEQRHFDELCGRISSVLAGSGIQLEDLLATLPKARRRLYKHRYATEAANREATSKRPRSHGVK